MSISNDSAPDRSTELVPPTGKRKPSVFWGRAIAIARYFFIVVFVGICLSIPIIIYSRGATNQLDMNIAAGNVTIDQEQMILDKRRGDIIYYVFCWLLTAWACACFGQPRQHRRRLALTRPFPFWRPVLRKGSRAGQAALR